MSKGEKDAFDAMMEEIGDSDEDDIYRGRNKQKTKLPIAQPKPVKVVDERNYLNDYKTPPPYNEPLSKMEQDIENFGVASNNGGVGSNSLDALKKAELLELKRWLMLPCRPGEPPLKCYVERDKSGFNRLHPVYR